MKMQSEHKEGEYPFYPIAPEYGVVKPVTFMVITDEKTLEEKPVIDYSGGITNTEILKWGN